jgi:NADH-quinone oxidoreductase subunit L
LSIIGGAIGFPEIFHFPHKLNEFLSPIYAGSKSVNPEFGVIHIDHSTEWILMGVSVLVAVIAIVFAYTVYGNGKNVPGSDESMSGIKKVVYDKYYIDELYNNAFVNSISSLSKFFGNVIDNKFIDGIVNGVGSLVNQASAQVKKIQVGGTSSYLLFMTIGIILLLGYSLVPGLFESLKSIIK